MTTTQHFHKILSDIGLPLVETEPEGKDLASYVIDLPGEKKLKTKTLISLSPHGARFEAFICRKPDENFLGVYKYLLRRNRKFYIVSYTIDTIGDIYLVGQISNDMITASEIDRIIGQILEAADADFNIILELGFASSIRREWKWRVSRGESLANLKAFEHLISEEEAESEEETE